jgi:hypothetical protein
MTSLHVSGRCMMTTTTKEKSTTRPWKKKRTIPARPVMCPILLCKLRPSKNALQNNRVIYFFIYTPCGLWAMAGKENEKKKKTHSCKANWTLTKERQKKRPPETPPSRTLRPICLTSFAAHPSPILSVEKKRYASHSQGDYAIVENFVVHHACARTSPLERTINPCRFLPPVRPEVDFEQVRFTSQLTLSFQREFRYDRW